MHFFKEYLIYSHSIESLILDLYSYTTILIILLILLSLNYINKKIFLFFSLYSCTPFFFNDVIIDSESMWDQYTNTYHLINFRNNLFSGNYFDSYLAYTYYRLGLIKLTLASHLYGLTPFIFINSINSIAFINKLLICLTSIYLMKENYIRKSHLFFLLIYPSTIIYSSLSLKEILIAVSCVWLIILFNKKKYFYAIILFLILFLIRPLFYGFVFVFFIYYLILLRLYEQKLANLIFHIIILILIIIFSQDIIDKINYYILVYNIEDVGWESELNTNNVNTFQFSLISFLTNINIVIDKLIINWPVPFKYKLIFVIENMILLYFIFKNFSTDYNKSRSQTIVSTFFLLVSIFTLYIIFPNMLPLHRYMYPFIFFYIIFSKFNFNENHSLNK